MTTVWRRGREIFLATNDGTDEQLIGSGEQPWSASTTDGPIVVWSTRRDGELKIKNVFKKYEHTIAANTRDAVVVAEPANGKTVFVFWEKNENGRTSILSKAVELVPSRREN